MIEDESVNHEYLPLPGLVSMLEATARLVFGANSAPIVERRCAVRLACERLRTDHFFNGQARTSADDLGERG